MTGLTGIAGGYVPGRFGVAISAGTENFIMIDSDNVMPGKRAVAGDAFLCCANVASRLAGGLFSVVAVNASTDYFSVVHNQYWNPDICIVAGAAHVGYRYVQGGFAAGYRSVMAGNAFSHCLGVIDYRADGPGQTIVASSTLIAAWRMGNGLSKSKCIVVAALAGAEYFIVVHSRYRYPCIGAMAGETVVRCRNMVGTLADRGYGNIFWCTAQRAGPVYIKEFVEGFILGKGNVPLLRDVATVAVVSG